MIEEYHLIPLPFSALKNCNQSSFKHLNIHVMYARLQPNNKSFCFPDNIDMPHNLISSMFIWPCHPKAFRPVNQLHSGPFHLSKADVSVHHAAIKGPLERETSHGQYLIPLATRFGGLSIIHLMLLPWCVSLQFRCSTYFTFMLC
jgi:hypothetical protein